MKTNHNQEDDFTDQEDQSAMDKTAKDSTATPYIPWKKEQFQLIGRIKEALQDDALQKEIGQGKRSLLRSDLGDLSDLEAVLPGELIDGWLAAYSRLSRCARQLYDEHPEAWCSPEEDVLPALAPMTQAAYDAAEAEWRELLAKFPGQYVLYHGSERVAIDPDDNKLLNIAVAEGYTDEQVMLFLIEGEPPSPDIED